MEEDNIPIPDDISSLEAELEFQELEKSIAEFNKGYDEPIDSRFLWNYIGGRQMGYGDDELQIIEDTEFSKIMDYMDENDLHYTEVDVYDFIPEDKRLSPYLIYKENIRNEYYTDDFVEYMTLVTRRTPSGIYDMKTDDILDAPPSHYMAEYALKGASEQGPTVRLEVWSKIINGAVTDGFLKKLKFKDFFKKAYQRTQNRDLIIRHINNLFPGGSYEAYLEENHNRNMERMGFTPEGDWLPEIKEKMVIKYTDVDGNVTYKDFWGNELDADDPRISDDSKFDDLVKQLEPSPEELTEEEKIKKLYDDNILTEKEYEQALKKEGNWADTPTNVVDDVVITQDSFGRDVTIPIDENGNIILYRATDDPSRIIDSDFRPLAKDKGSVGLGQQSYFSPNPMYSHKYQSLGRKNYKFVTQIKPNEILPTDMFVKNYPELVSALNIPEEYTNQNWRQLVNNDKAMIAMGYETGGKRFFNDNIQTFIDNGIKAFGSGATGTGGQTYIEYEIIPLVKEGDTLGIKPVATLQTKEGFAAGKSPEAFIETPIDTPTNVVDEDIVIKGIFTSRATNPKGPSLIYADVEEIFDFVEYNRREAVATDASNETIDAIKETIKQKGYVYDTGEYMNSGVAFPVSVDVSGDIQIAEGNHRLIAAYEVAQETGQKIYVPIYVYPSGVNKNYSGETYKGRSRNVGKEKLYKALRQLFIDSGASEYSVNEKVGETLGATKQYTGTNYLGSGGTGGNSVSQENMKKFFDAIGIETFTYEELPEDNVFKTGVSQLADTPTNVVDDIPTLNTDLVWRQDLEPIENIRNLISNTNQPRWRDGVVEKNNILKPNLKQDDIKRIIPQILDGTVSDIDFTRFGIWLLHKSPTPAYGSKPFNSSDALADVTKIVIFNGKSPIDLINEDTLEMVKNYITSDTGAFTTDLTKGPNAGSKSSMGLSDELILQFGREEGPFANAQQRMKQTIINEHNKLYANADDYFILFRGGALTNDPIQSFSKDGFQAHSVGFQTNQQTIRQGRGIDAYFVNKNDFIDLHSLGLDAKGEVEVIVYREGVNKPFQKTVMDESVRDFNYLDKNRLKFLEDNWIMISDEFPKTGFINSIKPDDPTRNQTLRVMDDTSDITNASTRVQQVAFDFAKNNGLAEPNFNAIAYFNPEVGVEAADIYQGLPDFDDSAVPLYNKFIKETNAQYDALINAGIQFELVDTDPYTPNAAGHTQMINDMQNGRLKVLATSSAGELPQGSPMGQVSKYTDVNGRQMLENDVFRAVHDTFGHGMRGNTFGPIGEYNAWLAHKEMYTSTSQKVMTTETLGQNTYVNFGPHMRTEEGTLIGKGDTGYIPPKDRPFAPQKVAVMPDNIITKAGDVATDATGLVNANAMNKVRKFISNTPDAAESLWKATKFTLGKTFRGLQIFDPGDIAIEYGLARLLPRLGLAAIAGPALYAYVFYELAVLATDVGQALNKAREKQGLGTVAESGGAIFGGIDSLDDWKQLGKDTWSEMGEVSDDWSLSWKISEPIINKVFEEYGKMKVAKEEKDYFSNLKTGLAPR